MKVRVVNRPSGILNGRPWPEVGEELDLPDVVAEGMAKAGSVEFVKAKPAKKAAEKKAAAKPEDKVEKRPAPTAGVETREGKAKA